MIRVFSLSVLALLGALLAACSAGAPSAAGQPSPTPAQLAAVNPAPNVAVAPTPSPGAVPPTATPVPPQPSPTAAAKPAADAAEASDSTTAGEAISRLPAPTPDASGMSLLYRGDHALSEMDDDSTLPLQVALTFDAGADTGYAAEILDVLADHDIKASFGMTGQWAENNRDLVKRIVDEGHMVFNHTWTHKSLTGVNGGLPPMTREELLEELASTEAIVKELTGYEMKPYFRPPYGDYDAQTLGWLADAGYHVTVMWTCDSYGWDGWSADKIVGYCATNLARNEVILMHVGLSAAGDYEALPDLIQSFADQGHAFVTVEEMIQP